MAYTDDFFSFPIRVYKKKNNKDDDDYDYTEWALGIGRLPRQLLKEQKLYWYEGFSADRTMEDVAENGFDITIVCTMEYGDFTCGWKKEKFEKKLNEFMERKVVTD